MDVGIISAPRGPVTAPALIFMGLLAAACGGAGGAAEGGGAGPGTGLSANTGGAGVGQDGSGTTSAGSGTGIMSPAHRAGSVAPTAGDNPTPHGAEDAVAEDGMATGDDAWMDPRDAAGRSPEGMGLGTVGSRCQGEQDCADGLTCLESDSLLFGHQSPAFGLCTTPCVHHRDCDAMYPGSYCVAFDVLGSMGYCVEGCAPGDTASTKCQARSEMACNLIEYVDSEARCESDEDCERGQLCNPDSRRCAAVRTACTPACGGDFDCPGGLHCDFATGMCSDSTPLGLPMGSRCDTTAMPDPCSGYCDATSDGSTEGTCRGICSMNEPGIGCGWDGAGPANAACLYAARVSDERDIGTGDVMICGALCDCNDDCDGLQCLADDTGTIAALWGRKGYCAALPEGASEADSIACE